MLCCVVGVEHHQVVLDDLASSQDPTGKSLPPPESVYHDGY